jgi:hypothetical protein
MHACVLNGQAKPGRLTRSRVCATGPSPSPSLSAVRTKAYSGHDAVRPKGRKLNQQLAALRPDTPA